MNPEFTAARPDTSIEGALEGNFLFLILFLLKALGGSLFGLGRVCGKGILPTLLSYFSGCRSHLGVFYPYIYIYILRVHTITHIT